MGYGENNNELKSPALKKPVKVVVSIDGGGVRGIVPATLLKEVEDSLSSKLGKREGDKLKIIDIADYFCGTSTGGLISLMLTSGKTIEECIDLYKKKAPEIFSRTWAHRIKSGLGLLKAKYDVNTGLLPLLEETFQGKLLKEAQKPVTVCAFCEEKADLILLDSKKFSDPNLNIILQP